MSEKKDVLESYVVKIQNQERMIRQRALKSMLEFCASEGNLSSETAVDIFDSVYLALIKCYSDKFEMCRSLSCSIVSEILKYIEENDYYLSLLVPVIAKRLATEDLVEESEEMRLQLLKQLNFIINKYKDLNASGTVHDRGGGDDLLLKTYNDIIDILKICLLDSYPAILKESCEVIKATAATSTSFHYRAETLSSALINLLKHRHSTIRIAAIEALGIVTLNIHSNGEQIKRIINALSPLVMDEIPFVRRECGRVGCRFLIDLRDRYSFFERILPLVLCCLSDETLEVRDEIEKLWMKAGAKYYTENENELQNLDLIDSISDNYPDFIKQRPSLGCRAIVRRSLQVLNIILREMEDWKEDVRLHSTKLLMQVVIHSESHLATKYFDINAVLCKTCHDPEIPIGKCALEIAKLCGRFVDQATWSKYAFDELKIRQNKLGTLKCLNALYQNCTDEKRFENLKELSEILLDTSICQKSEELFQSELMSLLESLIEGIPKEDETFVEKNFYVIALKSTAVSYDNERIRATGVRVLKRLVEKASSSSFHFHDMKAMHGKFLKSALDTLDLLDTANDDSFEQVLVLYGIICLCGFQKSFIDDLKRVILTALEHCEAEGKIKIFSGIAMASLNWNQTIDVDDPKENFLMLASFVGEIISPHLIWNAGQTAESVRSMATASLCALVQGTTPEHARKIVESLMTVLVSLIDDHNIATRSYVLKTLQYVGPLKYEQTTILSRALLTRLDDPGSEVREKAAKCLGNLELARHEGGEDEDVWENLLKTIFDTMLIHVETPEINVRENLIDSITTLSRKYPKLYDTAISESTIPQDLKCRLP
ncbi:CLUMA_CG005196, isoform A [Clunio marinus]|uniref:CLUMA_CG005196, isoform A n=1 Tax=Clunio marinus TaxID=568069 RepID=A0A1J1HZH7_9DIPT|nr:CLUMA_CG005196, isoform A [Clunio marinus]